MDETTVSDSAIVMIGSRVTVEGASGTVTVTIVASRRDVGLNRLLASSPLAKALLGRRAGDEVQVQVAAGTFPCRITSVDP